MVQGLSHYLKQAWKKPDDALMRERMNVWRNSDAVVRVEKPLRLDRAHSLGYKAKVGFLILRVRLPRGGRQRARPRKARMSKNMTIRKTLSMNYRTVAEQRAAKRFTNLEVLNSYLIGKDGIYYYFEVIMVDPTRPEIKNDKDINWICKPRNKNRAMRGLTSAGKKSRGLRNKTPELKSRPSLRAHNRQGN